MNVEIGTEAAQFIENEYINGIFLAVCSREKVPICKEKRGLGVYSLNKTGDIGGKCSVLGQMRRHIDSVSYS
jgi:hypothetical protein